jgi:hypothetical protein
LRSRWFHCVRGGFIAFKVVSLRSRWFRCVEGVSLRSKGFTYTHTHTPHTHTHTHTPHTFSQQPGPPPQESEVIQFGSVGASMVASASSSIPPAGPLHHQPYGVSSLGHGLDPKAVPPPLSVDTSITGGGGSDHEHHERELLREPSHALRQREPSHALREREPSRAEKQRGLTTFYMRHDPSKLVVLRSAVQRSAAQSSW